MATLNRCDLSTKKNWTNAETVDEIQNIIEPIVPWKEQWLHKTAANAKQIWLALKQSTIFFPPRNLPWSDAMNVLYSTSEF